MYTLGQEKYPTFSVIWSWVQQHLNWQVLPRNISDIYVSRMVIYHPLIDYFLSGINNQPSNLWYSTKKMSASLLTEDLSCMKCLLHHLKPEEYIIQQEKKTISNISVRIYLLTLHLWYIIFVNGKISNI